MRGTTKFLITVLAAATLGACTTQPDAAPAPNVDTTAEVVLDEPPAASPQSAEDAAYVPPALGELVAQNPAGWEEHTVGGIAFATPPGWDRDPDFPESMVRQAGWLSHDTAWALHGPNPAKVSVNHSPNGGSSFDLAVKTGTQVYETPEGLLVAARVNPNDDVVLGRHVNGSAFVVHPDFPDEYHVSFTLPPDDASVDLVRAVVGSIRPADGP